MSLILSTVLPIFALLLLGYWARRSDFLNEAFWVQAERGTYYVLFPCLLIAKLASAKLEWLTMLPLIAGALLIPIAATVVSWALKAALKLNGADFTSFFQGSIRFNTYIGLALATVLPSPALTLATVVFAVMIPLINVFCVLAFALTIPKALKPITLLRIVAKNPLIMACMIGVLLNLLPWSLPNIVLDLLNKLGVMALPLGLLAVGAGLQLRSLSWTSGGFMMAAMLKLVLLPLIALSYAYLIQLDVLSTQVLVLFAALPTASSSYILARQLGGNAPFMAAIISGQTLLSVFSLPLVLAWLMV